MSNLLFFYNNKRNCVIVVFFLLYTNHFMETGLHDIGHYEHNQEMNC